MLLCVFLPFVIRVVYSIITSNLGIFKMKSVLIKETMKEIKGNIIGGKLLLNFGAKIKFHIGSRVQNCYNTMTFSTSQCQDGVKVLNRLWMKMSGPLKDSFENLKTRNSTSRILTGIFSKKLENSAIKPKFRPWICYPWY